MKRSSLRLWSCGECSPALELLSDGSPKTKEACGARMARRRNEAVSAVIQRVEADAASRDAARFDVRGSVRQNLGGEAMACVTGVLATYAASAAHFRGTRRDCVERCGNSNRLWDWSEIEPAKISEE